MLWVVVAYPPLLVPIKANTTNSGSCVLGCRRWIVLAVCIRVCQVSWTCISLFNAACSWTVINQYFMPTRVGKMRCDTLLKGDVRSNLENSMQKACTSMNKSWTLIILLRMRLCKNTHTSRTSRFCMYLSLMFSHDDMQLEMYRCTNSIGSSTACHCDQVQNLTCQCKAIQSHGMCGPLLNDE